MLNHAVHHDLLTLARRLAEESAPAEALSCATAALQLLPEDHAAIDAAAACVKAIVTQADGRYEPAPDRASVRQLLARMGRLMGYLQFARAVDDQPPVPVEGASGDPADEALRAARVRELKRVLEELSDAASGTTGQLFRLVDETCLRYGVRRPDLSSRPHHSQHGWESLSLEHQLHNAGNALYVLESYEPSVRFYTEALVIAPLLMETYFNRALAYTRLAKYGLAEADLLKAIELNHDVVDLHYTLGLVYRYMDRLEQDRDSQLEALRIDPDHEKAKEELAEVERLLTERRTGDSSSSSSDSSDQIVRDPDTEYAVDVECTFDDVGGNQTAKESLSAVVWYLAHHDHEAVLDWGGEVPNGVLLWGPSGCGKTLLARATAGEANCQFYAPTVADLMSMWSGSTEKNLQNLFRAAERHGRAIIYFEEFDSMGQQRCAASDPGGEQWMARHINTLLGLMDGLRDRSPGVVVIADTNRPDNIDRAFLRPGRLDLIVEVRPPQTAAEWAPIWMVQLARAERRARRLDFLHEPLRDAVRADPRRWVEMAFDDSGSSTGVDPSGLAELCELSLDKELVPADTAEVIRRTVRERVGVRCTEGFDLGPLDFTDLHRHLATFEPFRPDAT